MRRHTRLVLIAASVFVVGAALSVVVSYGIYERESAAQRERLRANVQELRQSFTQFDYSTRLYQSEVENSLDRKLEALAGLREYIAAEPVVGWDDYHDYVSPILDRYDAITGVFWIPRVNRDALARFEQIAEESGPPDFELQYGSDGDSPSEIATWPIYYAAPLEPNRSWIGRNAATHPIFAAVFDATTEETGPWLSTSFSAEGESRPRDLFIALKLNTDGEGFSVGSGEAALHDSGLVAALIHIPSLVSSAMERVDAEPVELFLFDSDGRRIATYGDIGEEALQASRNEDDLLETLTGATYVDREIEVSADGRSWRLIFRPTEPIGVSIPDSYRQPKTAWLVAIVGMVLSIGLAALAYFLSGEMVRRKSSEERQRKLAQYDGLTGLLNRRSLSEQLQLVWSRLPGPGRTLSALMIDLDHFKSVNDTYGHASGDDVLRKLGEILREVSRQNDLAARYGGEEFCLILPDTDSAEARAAAERVRRELGAQSFETASGIALRITCSVGVASVTPTDRSPGDVLKRADGALYTAKESGRNRVSVAPE
ncbi:MAG: diguanylate cyclase [Spirochaetaceae bacterium]